jgi:lipopolysaccharide/colanic/teichoic acid biosynthesis glycosyltransferase
MNHLAGQRSLKVSQFDMSSFFFTDTFLFRELHVGQKTVLAFETFFALFLLLLLSPVMLAVAVAIKISMGGNVFYTQVRVGKNGKLFNIYKFRSMIENAESTTGAVLSCKDDPRVTTLGKFLRASHFDELPQLFNVISGDMSFVGPRPERPEFVNEFNKEIADYKKRSLVKPGITGLAQICLPYDATASEKLEYDLYYIDHHRSVLFNLMISYYTAIKMVNFSKNQ